MSFMNGLMIAGGVVLVLAGLVALIGLWPLALLVGGLFLAGWGYAAHEDRRR